MIQQNYSLKKLNTFNIDSHAEYFFEFSEIEELKEILSMQEFKNTKKHILGSGANVLLSEKIDGLVLHPKLKGIKWVSEDNEKVKYKVSAGENWIDLVTFISDIGLGGIENLAYIPGNMGAAPVQNINAYGQELSKTFVELTAINLDSAEIKRISKDEMKFGYRTSLFKSQKTNYLILDVTLQFDKNPIYDLNYSNSYGGVAIELELLGMSELNPHNIATAITSLRKKKLHDVSLEPNAGSFFRNITVDQTQLEKLQLIEQDLRSKNKELSVLNYYKMGNELKLNSGWLVEAAGLKGFLHKGAQVSPKHALVLLNKNNASGKEIDELANIIVEKVEKIFGVVLQREVVSI
jgi:UDP-N-acetylmuramate dehydrogenase